MTAKAAKAPTKKTKTAKSTKPAAASKSKTVTKSVAAKSADTKPVKVKKKFNPGVWSIRWGILLVALAVAVIVFAKDATTPVTIQYLAKDALQSEAAATEVLAPATRHLWDMHVSWLVAKFLLIFGVVLLLAGTLMRAKYEAWLAKGVNKLRWVGLGLGGASVFVTISMLSGVNEVSKLTLICGSVLLAGLLAASVELLGPGRRLRRLLAAGAILAIFMPWLVVMRTAASVPLFNGSLPAYMYYLYASVTLLVVATGLALYLRIKQKGKWADTLYTEKMFMGLTLAAAVIPALQIFAGALR